MSGIGIIIILIQSLPFLGAPVVAGGAISAVGKWPEVIGNVDFNAFSIAAVTLIVGVFWPSQARKFLPPALAALIIGTLLGILRLSGTPVIGDVPTGLPNLQLPDLSVRALVHAVQPAFTIALLGSMTRTSHNPNKELIGQGIGNAWGGLNGGLPGAGATMGTVENIRAGGRTQVSGALRSVILLALVLGLGDYVELIPHAVLAGILLKVGWDIVDWRFLTRLHRVQREHLGVMAISLGQTVFLDLVTAVAIGLIAAGMASARQSERLELDSVISVPLFDQSFLENRQKGEELDAFGARVGLLKLRGSFTVASSIKLTKMISLDIQEHEVVILDFSETVYIDDSAALVVEQLIDTATTKNIGFIVLGLNSQPATTLYGLHVLRNVPAGNVVASMDDAREVAQGILRS